MARTAKRYSDKVIKIQNNDIETFYVGIYSRLSVDNNSRKSESIENQIEIISQYISDNNSNPYRKMNLKIYDT
ncbi:MAG: hypothetical protein K2M60_01915, partial [Lachnospiraceae bacterium]|nr:hypothetical protein [Lachnospiraceae bacterium]